MEHFQEENSKFFYGQPLTRPHPRGEVALHSHTLSPRRLQRLTTLDAFGISTPP